MIPRVLALIPAYNEAEHIARVVKSARVHLPVLVVDDGSGDDTAQRAEAAGASVLRQSPNQGKGAALRAGFRRAMAEGYDAVLTLDADGQHDPAEMPAFVKSCSATQADLIVGQRDFRKMPWARRLANTLGRWLFSWAMGRPIADNQSGFRLLSRRLMEAVLDSGESGFEFEVDMIAVCVERGWTIEWVPIRTIYAGEKSHIRPGAHTLNFVRVVWQLRQRRKKQEADCPPQEVG
jgi:glycosyltransferase involved in cell wall biosynthesis